VIVVRIAITNVAIAKILFAKSFLINKLKVVLATITINDIPGAINKLSVGTNWLLPVGFPYNKGTTGGRKLLRKTIADITSKSKITET